MAEEIGHPLGFDLKPWHRWSITTDDLMNDRSVTAARRDASKAGPHQPLACDAVTSSTVDPEQLASVLNISTERQRCFAVGVESVDTE